MMLIDIKINNFITVNNRDWKKRAFFFKNQCFLFIEAGNTDMIVGTVLFNSQTALFLCFNYFFPFFLSFYYQKDAPPLLSTSSLYLIIQLFIIASLFVAYLYLIFKLKFLYIEYKNGMIKSSRKLYMTINHFLFF